MRACSPTALFMASASVLLAAALLAGCQHNGSSSNSTADVSAGQAVFNRNCEGCHEMDGVGGRRGPDLSHIGADQTHTPSWIAAYVQNPRSVDPSSRMPAFGNRLSQQDLQAVGAYLATKK